MVLQIQASLRCRAAVLRARRADAEAAALHTRSGAIVSWIRHRRATILVAQRTAAEASALDTISVVLVPCVLRRRALCAAPLNNAAVIHTRQGSRVRFSVGGQERVTRSPLIRPHGRPVNGRLYYSRAWLLKRKRVVRAARRKAGQRSKQPRREWEAEQTRLRSGLPGCEEITVLLARRVAALNAAVPSDHINPLLEQVAISVLAVSPRPLSGNVIVWHVRAKLDDIVTRFLACVDSLVDCQQELWQGLQLAQRGLLTPCQFLAAHVAPLPGQFAQRSTGHMPPRHLQTALIGLVGLVRDVEDAIPHGCERAKDAFLGGLRENESWGLRKWLSRHGGAGSVCNNLEEVVQQVKRLEKDDTATQQLAEQLRPVARRAHERLKEDMPTAYQERSDAHPHLPFFHRLEACLGQMATYDPENDGVICLDNNDDEEEEDVAIEAVACLAHGGRVGFRCDDPGVALSPRCGPLCPARHG